MLLEKTLPWISPIEIARKIAANHDKNWLFLYSGLNQEIKNSTSIIAVFAKKELFLNDLKDLKTHLQKPSKNYENAYFGYVSYEYKNKLENFKTSKNSFINLPEIYFANFSLILEFNHEKQELTAFFENENQLIEILNYQEKNQNFTKISVEKLASNFTQKSYLKAINSIRDKISKGDFYQTNLTRKFFGKTNPLNNSDFFNIFEKLTNTSSANYSSFIKINDNFIISASPELFFSSENNKILSRPIKGTAARGNDLKQDEENKKYLQTSQKERAENLMIVDLVRNDLSRCCKPSSIEVKNLFKVDSYKKMHHMSSEIIGKIDENHDIIDAFESLFPAGSMTGAPKIKAIEFAQELEQINRGIYSGAIGYFKGFTESNFSVVIRTLICKKQQNHTDFEFQTGGAITYDSKPEQELEETFIKAKAIFEILNIKT